MKEISLIAATFYGNRGAEGMLSASIGELRTSVREELKFNVFTYYPQSDPSLVDDPGVACYSSTPAYLVLVLIPCAFLFRLLGLVRLPTVQARLPQSVQAMARSKVLICLAGVSFVEGRAKFLPFNVATILPAMVLGRPVVKFAQAMGPFKSKINRITARFFLSRCHQVFTRGDKTQSHLVDLLPNGKNYQRADDVAFLFRKEYCLSRPADSLANALEQLQRHR